MRPRLFRALLMLAIVGSLAGLLGAGVAAHSYESCDLDLGTWHVCVGAGSHPIVGAAYIRNDFKKAYGVILDCVPEGAAGHYYLYTQAGGNKTFEAHDLGVVPLPCPSVV